MMNNEWRHWLVSPLLLKFPGKTQPTLLVIDYFVLFACEVIKYDKNTTSEKGALFVKILYTYVNIRFVKHDISRKNKHYF